MARSRQMALVEGLAVRPSRVEDQLQTKWSRQANQMALMEATVDTVLTQEPETRRRQDSVYKRRSGEDVPEGERRQA